MAQLSKTTKPISEKDIQRGWHLIDAKQKVVGRIAPHIATLLQGKHKASYVPHIDSGDYVVVINASEMIFTGHKLDEKIYTRYSGYPDGLKQERAGEVLKKSPSRVLTTAVAGMLPKNKLRDRRIARLYVFAHGEHPYQHKFSKQG